LEELGLNGTSTLKFTLENERRSVECINLAKDRMPVNLCEGCNELSVSKNFGHFLLSVSMSRFLTMIAFCRVNLSNNC
jgi:hypothetical protein